MRELSELLAEDMPSSWSILEFLSHPGILPGRDRGSCAGHGARLASGTPSLSLDCRRIGAVVGPHVGCRFSTETGFFKQRCSPAGLPHCLARNTFEASFTVESGYTAGHDLLAEGRQASDEATPATIW